MVMTREEAQEAMACSGCVYWRQEFGAEQGLKENEGYCYYERRVHVKRTDQFCADHARIVDPTLDMSVPIYEGIYDDGTDN